MRVWTALLSRGVSTAGELSDIGNVPRSRAYDVLESLEKKGFVVMKLGKPIKYVAVEPEEVVDRVKKLVSEQAKENVKKLDELNCRNVLICGIEAHVCVYQTAVDLLNDNKRVTLIVDAISSRTLENKQIAITELRHRGVSLSSVEMLLFELLKTAEHSEFRQIAKLIK